MFSRFRFSCFWDRDKSKLGFRVKGLPTVHIDGFRVRKGLGGLGLRVKG